MRTHPDTHTAHAHKHTNKTKRSVCLQKKTKHSTRTEHHINTQAHINNARALYTLHQVALRLCSLERQTGLLTNIYWSTSPMCPAAKKELKKQKCVR